MSVSEILSIAGFVVVVVGLYVIIKVDIASLKTKCKNACDVIPNMVVEVRELKTYNDIFRQVLEPHFAKIIHSPTHHRRDELVDKLVHGKINMNEAKELDMLLGMAVEESDDSGKKLAAAFLLARTRTMIANANHKSPRIRQNGDAITD